MTATLSGVNIADASGNRLTDGSAAYIVEQGIQVVVDGAGILHNVNMGQDADLWTDFLDWLKDPTGFGEVLALTPQIQNLTNGVGIIIDNLEKLLYVASASQVSYAAGDHTYNGYTLNKLIADIAAIEPGTGGLTQEEHDQLMLLANLDYNQIASTVWGYTLPVDYLDGTYWGPMAQTALRTTMEYLQTLVGYDGLPVPGNPWFRYVNRDIETTVGYYTPWSTMTIGTALPLLDLSLVQDGDTVLSFLTREYPLFDWTTTGPVPAALAGTVWLWEENATDGYRCVLTDADMRVQNVPGQIETITVDVTNITAPVWPGLAGVTVGAAIPLSNGLEVSGPLHGLLFTITSQPVQPQVYHFGAVNSWGRVGQVIFCTDRGDYERSETFALDQQIVVPKTMKEADSAIIRLNAGWGGTVRPWTINP